MKTLSAVLLMSLLSGVAAAQSRVPFVGCVSYTQLDPLPAPRGEARALAIAKTLADRLAYYKAAYSFGVLAPRGWQCVAHWGSSGYYIVLTPTSSDRDVYRAIAEDPNRPAVEIIHDLAGTSGRYQIAEVMARIFPVYRTRAVQELEGMDIAAPPGPFPADTLTYRGDKLVEYETPPGATGLGSFSRLARSTYPVHGFAMLVGDGPDLLLVGLRLPPDLSALAPVMLGQLEADAQR